MHRYYKETYIINFILTYGSEARQFGTWSTFSPFSTEISITIVIQCERIMN